jgi:3',5'-cyclic AMP phosphodiesterase CpdA
MPLDPVTFRDHFLSLYQSAVDQAVRSQLPAGAPRPGLENGLVRAAAQVATFTANGTPVPQQAPASFDPDAWTAARLALELLDARLHGRTAEAAAIEDQLKDGKFDLNWANTIAQYVQYYGPDGKLRAPEYIPASPNMPVIPFKAAAIVGIMADWGTGTATAVNLLNQMAQFDPDVIIHLGDIYYSGTPDECHRNFAAILNRTFDRSRVPIYNLAGNHDMYCGGVGYYGLLKTLNPPPLPAQPASFFCLRSADKKWQFIAMDTGRADRNPFNVTDVLVKIDSQEEAWLSARITEFSGKTILLSHHQFFSAFAQIGPARPDGSLTAYNPNLDATFNAFVAAAQAGDGEIAAWFWGHEHTLTVYDSYRNLAKGRCIGHGAIPVLAQDNDSPLKKIVDPPGLVSVPLGVVGHVHAHGFVILRFGHDGSCRAEYYNDSDPGRPAYSEAL